MTDLFAPPTQQEVRQRREERERNCKYEWTRWNKDGKEITHLICCNCMLEVDVLNDRLIQPSYKRRNKTKV